MLPNEICEVFLQSSKQNKLVIVQGVAAEKKRSTRDIKVNKLVKNGDASRKFPEGGRRLEKSPLV